MEPLVIAEGTPWQITVRDVRNDDVWANPSWDSSNTPHDRVFLHHTTSPKAPGSADSEMAYMRRVRDEAPYGLPYNFIIFNYHPYRIYYLNDVDIAFPHTFANNDDVAISAAGNFEVEEPRYGMVRRIWRLRHAIGNLWGNPDIPFLGHRDVYPTACPGSKLYHYIYDPET